jgi:hypothetical protein
MKRLLFIALLFGISLESMAQSPLAFAPWQIEASTYSAESGDVSGVLIGLKRVVPVASLLPQTTSDSKIELLGVQLGAQLLEQSYERLHFRATAIDMLIQRGLMTGAFQLLDYDRSGIQEVDANWIGLATGPGIHGQGSAYDAALRLLASARLSTWKFGSLISTASPLGLQNQTGADLGLELIGSAKIAEKVIASIAVGSHRLTGSELNRRNVLMQMGYLINPKWTFVLQGFKYEFESEDRSTDSKGIGIQLSYTPGAVSL